MTIQATHATTDEETAATPAAVAALRFLGDPTRLQVLRALAAGSVYGSDLAERLGLPQGLAAYHLRRLAEAGLVSRERREHRVYYALDASIGSITRSIRTPGPISPRRCAPSATC